MAQSLNGAKSVLCNFKDPLLCNLDQQRAANCLQICSKHVVDNVHEDLIDKSSLESVAVP